MTSATVPIGLPENLRGQARHLCRTMAAIHRRGWCEGTGGNFSCVIAGDPLQLLMAPSGVDKGTVKPADLIVVNAQGQIVSGAGRVSAELALHKTIVLNTGAGAVLHTHSQAATLLSLQAIRRASPRVTQGTDWGEMANPMQETGEVLIEGLEMLKGLEGIDTHTASIRIPVLSNDQNLDRLSEAAEPHLGSAPHGILIAGHGLYAWGADLAQAMRHLEIHEFLLEQKWRQSLWQSLQNRTS